MSDAEAESDAEKKKKDYDKIKEHFDALFADMMATYNSVSNPSGTSQTSSKEDGPGNGKKPGKKTKKTKKKTQSMPDAWYDLPVLGKATQAGDELTDKEYINAALSEGTAIMELFMWAEASTADAIDSIIGIFSKKIGIYPV